MRVDSRAGMAAGWSLTRAPLLLVAAGVVGNPWAYESADIGHFYAVWARVLATGAFPAHDSAWQYPPGAAALIWLPRLFGDYRAAFFGLTLAADAVIMATLLAAGRGEGRSRLGPWLWVVAVPLLGPLVYCRYDVLVAVFAVGSTVAMARRPALGGALAAVGALTKIWPGLGLFGVPPARRGGVRALVTAALVGVATLAAIAATMSGSMSFLRFQRQRGVEIESVFAVPFLLARHLGWPGQAAFRYGSYEMVGPGVGVAGDLALVAAVAAFGWMLLWRLRCRRWTPAVAGDAALTATLLFILVSRVISPQYLIWVLALAAAALCRRETSQRPVAALLLAAAVLTQVEFPIAFSGLIAGHLLPALVVLARDALLVAATALSMGRLWRATTRPATGPAEPTGPERARATEPATEGQAG